MNIFLVIIFFAGMFFQAIFMLFGKWQEGDFKKIFLSIGAGFLGMLPGKREKNYDLGIHLFFASLAFAFAFTANFKDRLLVRIGARTLIIWNILFLSMILENFRFSPVLAVIIFIPTVLTVINGFTDIDRKFGWQVFFYAWFGVMVSLLGFYHFAFGNLRVLFQRGGVGQWFRPSGTAFAPPLEIFLTGAAFLSILSGAWFVLALIPIPLHKRQTYAERMVQVRAHMQLLAYGYIWQKDDFLGNAIWAVFSPVFLFLNHQFALVDESIIITLTLIFLPMFERLRGSGQYEFELHDGVGSKDKFSGNVFLGGEVSDINKNPGI